MTECLVHKLIADVAILAQNSILMVKYADTTKYDGQTGWFLPDDFLAHLEHPEDAAKRIAQEQAGLEIEKLDLGLVESFGDGTWHLVFHYTVELEKRPGIRAGENVAAIQWFPLHGLPPESEVAHHGWPLDVLDEIKARR